MDFFALGYYKSFKTLSDKLIIKLNSLIKKRELLNTS